MSTSTTLFRRTGIGAAIAGAFLTIGGCNVDSFMDPSRIGYYEHTPTTVPILDRIDVIEPDEEDWEDAERPTPADLVPVPLEYRLSAGDILGVEIYELFTGQTWARLPRRIDQAGNIRIPQVGDIQAAGLTLAELEEAIAARLQETIRDPVVTVTLDQGGGFTYSILGASNQPGLYPLSRPNLRLTEALAIARGVPVITKRIFIIRPVALSEAYETPFGPERQPGEQPEVPQGDLEDILEQLPDRDRPGGGAGGGGGVSDAFDRFDGFNGRVAAVRQDTALIDIDDFQLRRVSDLPAQPPSSKRFVNPRSGANDSFVYVEERGEWVRVSAAAGQDITGEMLPGQEEELVLERVIMIPYRELLIDDSYNVIIRPGDRIYVEPPPFGVVYIGGEVARPGVYELPGGRGELTLSQLVTAAGGPGPLAIPERVDLSRRVGEDRKATIRVNLAAIRAMTEPDIFIKPDDEIYIGTNWVAAPLAVIRNGFRATYGFGFLLDRNFGNDVFGAPPVNRLR